MKTVSWSLAWVVALLVLSGCGSVGASFKVSLAEEEPLLAIGVTLDPKIKQAVRKTCQTLDLKVCHEKEPPP